MNFRRHTPFHIAVQSTLVRRRVASSRLLSQVIALLAVVAIQTGLVSAQSPPTVITGPQISLTPGCALALSGQAPSKLTPDCVNIVYAADSSIAQNRYVLVPGGAIEFDLPVSSTIGKLIKGTIDNAVFVTVTVTGPNGGETALQKSSTSFQDKGQATIRIPVNVDWAESIVSFSIEVDEQSCLPGVQKNGEPNCSEGDTVFSGPDLSSVTDGANWVGANWPTPVTGDSFLVIATPAAAFQVPILPTTIIYGPLGNGSKATSSYSVTEIANTNQQFSNTNDQTHSVTNDDKTQFQAGLSLSLALPQDAPTLQDNALECGASGSCKLSLGLTYSHTWDHSTQKQDETSYGTSASVAFETQHQFTITIVPTPGQPSLDKLTADTQPFWEDVILGVSNAQYALWDYPAGPVIQALGGAALVAMPVRQLDHCLKAPGAIEPVSFSPGQWAPSSPFAHGTVILDSNGNIQVVTSSDGLSGSTAPAWNTVDGATTTDGSVTWTNEQLNFAVYRGALAQDAIQYVRLGPWEPGTAYPVGSVILGPASIEIATTAGISGASTPAWNATDESSTADGTVIWTNEQDHIIVSAGAAASRQSVFQWLTSDICGDYLSLDQFYVNQSQTATPLAYDALGSMLSLTPSNPVTYTNQNKTTSVSGNTTLTKHMTQITSIGTNTLGGSGEFSFVAGVLGLGANASLTRTWTTTTVNTAFDSNTLANTTTITGQAMSATTIQDLGSEQSIPANILLDSIFMGVAVQDTNPQSTLPAPTKATLGYEETWPAKLRGLPFVAVGHSSAMLRKADSSEPAEYVQQTNYGFGMAISKPPATPETEEYLRNARAASRRSHEQRVIPAPPTPPMR
jgi:hypothetical protein